jgi:hypothetical protein
MQDKRYKEIESDFLIMFRDAYGQLPLVNQNKGAPHGNTTHGYDDAELDVLANADKDSIYWWALTPRRKEVIEYFEKRTSDD